MATKKEEVKIITPAFRVSFPELAQPKGFNGSDPKYSVQMVFPNNVDISALKKIAIKVRNEKWGDDKSKHPKNLKMPFIDGNEKDLESHKDSTVINAKSKFKPGMVDQNREEILDANEIYAGCWARARVTCYAYDIKSVGSRGVAFGLTSIQKVKDDKAFSGRGNAKDDFDAVELEDQEFEETATEDEDF